MYVDKSVGATPTTRRNQTVNRECTQDVNLIMSKHERRANHTRTRKDPTPVNTEGEHEQTTISPIPSPSPTPLQTEKL